MKRQEKLVKKKKTGNFKLNPVKRFGRFPQKGGTFAELLLNFGIIKKRSKTAQKQRF